MFISYSYKNFIIKKLATFLILALLLNLIPFSFLEITQVKAAVSILTQPTELIESGQKIKASSTDVPLAKFKLSRDAGETLSSVNVQLNDANNSSLSSSDFNVLKLWKDGGNDSFDAGSNDDTSIAGASGSGCSVGTFNGGSGSTTLSSDCSVSPLNTSISGSGTTFFISLSTGNTWANGDGVTVKMSANAIETSSGVITTNALIGANTLSADTFPPRIYAVKKIDGTHFEIIFSENMSSGALSSTGSYTLGTSD